MKKTLSSLTTPSEVHTLLYARSAREDQSFPKTNVDGQLKELRNFIKTQGWVNRGEYADPGISGLTKERPGLNGLMNACRNDQVNVVVVTDLSRLAREVSLSLALLKQLKAMNIQVVVTRTESPSRRETR
jgi:site-specific DNA recombinase